MKIETITPVFIGSGNVLTGLEYFMKDDFVYFISLDELIKTIAKENYKEKCEYLSNFIKDNLKNNKVENKEKLFTRELVDELIRKEKYIRKVAVEKSSNFNKMSSNIQEFITTNNKPFIPGSSIKGAIITTIIYDAFDTIDFNLPISDKKKFEKDFEIQINNKIYEKYNKLLRYNDKEDFVNLFFNKISISDVNLNNFSGEIKKINTYGMSQKPNDMISLETYRGEGIIDIKSEIIDLENLKKITNRYFLKSLYYFEKNIKEEHIKRKIKELVENIKKNEYMYLIIGGHNGWYFKSLLDLVKEHPKFEEIRRKLNLGKHPKYNIYSKSFPKTYKLTKENEILGVVRIK
ncbi:MAG: type III-A CRISPR-associated RAMP protein Csm5 [Candidatus Woesearchaeota archaeon]